jgi:hypothetical protein
MLKIKNLHTIELHRALFNQGTSFGLRLSELLVNEKVNERFRGRLRNVFRHLIWNILVDKHAFELCKCIVGSLLSMVSGHDTLGNINLCIPRMDRPIA